MSTDSVRYCLITGAAGGIGRALVNVFAGGGYRVIGLDRVPKPRDLECDTWHEMDLNLFVKDSKISQVFFNAINREVAGYGLHALLNNAAVQILEDTDNLSREDWEQSLNVNLMAPFLLIQGLLSELEFAKGSVINIGSIHARLTKRKFVAYATSKAALAGMTRALAVDLQSRVRVNAIEPAAIETDMLRAGFDNDPDSYRKLEMSHPSQKIGHPVDVARLALSIASADMSFMHGACVGLDGGISGKLYDPTSK